LGNQKGKKPKTGKLKMLHAGPRVPDNDRILGRRLEDTPYVPGPLRQLVGERPISYDRLRDSDVYAASIMRSDLSVTQPVVAGRVGQGACDGMREVLKTEAERYDPGQQRTALKGSVGQPRATDSGETLPTRTVVTRTSDSRLGTIAPAGLAKPQSGIGHHCVPTRQILEPYVRGPTSHTQLADRPAVPTIRVVRIERRNDIDSGVVVSHRTLGVATGALSTPPTRQIHASVLREHDDVRRKPHYAEIGEIEADRNLGLRRGVLPPTVPAAIYADIGELEADRKQALRRGVLAASVPTTVYEYATIGELEADRKQAMRRGVLPGNVASATGPLRPHDVRGAQTVRVLVPVADRTTGHTPDRRAASATSSRSAPGTGLRVAFPQPRPSTPIKSAYTGTRKTTANLRATTGAGPAQAGTLGEAHKVRRNTERTPLVAAATSAHTRSMWREVETTTQRKTATRSTRVDVGA
jgi:hypothetical protein